MKLTPTQDEVIDLMIDVMAELEAIELNAQKMRYRITEISKAMSGTE